MRYSLWTAAALAPFALAAPKYDGWVPAQPSDSKFISTYFNQLAQKVGEGRHYSAAPVCDLSLAQMPVCKPTHLPTAREITLTHPQQQNRYPHLMPAHP